MAPLDSLSKAVEQGFAPCLVYDDEGHWAVSDEGVSPSCEKPNHVTVYVEDEWWFDSPDAAIKDYIERTLKNGQQ